MQIQAGLVPAWLVLCMVIGSRAARSEELPARELLRRAVNQELKAGAEDHTRWMFIVKSEKSGKQQEELVVQTRDADLSRLCSVNGYPITPEEAQQEDQRIEKLLNNPGELKRLRHAHEEDARRTWDLLRLFPDAVIATYGRKQDRLVEILFRPDPAFRPHTNEASVLHHMQGSIWVDARENRLAEVEGHLIEDVKFGGGLLGHLDRGGEFHFKQSEIAPGHWEMTLLHVNMHGRALYFKTIGVRQDQVRTNFQRVPDQLTLSAAADALRKQSTAKSVGDNWHRQWPILGRTRVGCSAFAAGYFETSACRPKRAVFIEVTV